MNEHTAKLHSSGSCQIFLIRHGETVDNVAGLYAGSRDSSLTNHGVQQTLRLGQHFANQRTNFTHIFSSNLSRAVKTAEAVRDAHSKWRKEVVDIVQVVELREQDFGSLEGKSFQTARISGSSTTAQKQRHDQCKDESGFQDTETKESMIIRANRFLDEMLLPILNTEHSKAPAIVAIVSHGILLSSLWRAMLRRQSKGTIHLDPTLLGDRRSMDLEHLGGWSNTGYLHLELSENKIGAGNGASASQDPGPGVTTIFSEAHSMPQAEDRSSNEQSPALHISRDLDSSKSPYCIRILSINNKSHLQGLKRTGGGVGSAKFEAGQKSINQFFKRKRTS